MLDDIIRFVEVTRYNTNFSKEKKRVDRILAEGGDFPNDGKVDPRVKDLVYELNRVPFVYSWCSCSGHFVTREDIFQRVGHRDESLLILPNEGYGEYYNGYLGLVFKPQTREYISKIRDIVKKYPAAVIGDWRPMIGTDLEELQDLRFEIRFDTRFNGDPSVIPITEGIERMDSVNRLIMDLHGLFRYNPE